MCAVYFRGMELEAPGPVYEPREDTELMARTVQIPENCRLLDLGTGSGALALLAAGEAGHVLATDVDERAIEAAERNAERNGREIEFRQSDLFSQTDGTFDVILFNPPYLPVAGEEPSWSGGEDGKEVIEGFAEGLGEHLSTDGKSYLLISSVTGLEETVELFEEKGFTVEVAAEEKVPWETLYCLKISPADA